ncbi:MAG: hypothetical protein ACFFAD_13305 [Candidatus Hermodarchaeota archaeon]
MAHKKAQDRPGLGRRLIHTAIVGAILASLLGVAINIAVPDVVEPHFDVTSTPAAGTAGSNVTVASLQSRAELTLQNGSSFDPDSGWQTEFRSINEGLPIVERTPHMSGVQIDLSNVAIISDYHFNLNTRDYEQVTFSLDLDVLRGPVEVRVGVHYYRAVDHPSYSGSQREYSLTTGDSTQFNLDLDADWIYNHWSSVWLVQARLRIGIVPMGTNLPNMASVIINNVTITASSSTPLSLLRVDVQNTEGSSIYEAKIEKGIAEWPAVNLTTQGDPERWGLLLPFRTNDTVYVSAGNYSGIAGTYGFGWVNQTYPISINIAPNTCTHLSMRFEMVFVNLLITPDIPYLVVNLEQPGVLLYDISLYHSFMLPSPFPQTICIPNRGDILIITLQIPSRMNYADYMLPRMDYAGRETISISGPMNIDIHLHMPLFSFFGILLSTGELLLSVFGLALLGGAILNLRRPGASRNWERIVRDTRFWPTLLIGISIFLPWFISFFPMNPEGSFYAGDSFMLVRALYPPIAISIDFTANSLALPLIRNTILIDGLIRVIIFWFPLYGAAMHIGWSSKWKLNFYYAAYILLPLCLGVLTLIFTPFPLGISIGFILAAAAPVLWGFQILIYQGHKRIKKRSGLDGVISKKVEKVANRVSVG